MIRTSSVASDIVGMPGRLILQAMINGIEDPKELAAMAKGKLRKKAQSLEEALLEATAYVGVEGIRLVCRGETEVVPRQRRGGKRISYRHYLPELARKPQAVRQVAPELVAELGEPYGRLWSPLVGRYGAREAARVLSRVLGAVLDHSSETVAEALEAALDGGRCDLLAVAGRLRQVETVVEVPVALKSYEIEAGSPADYDILLQGGVR